MLAPGVAISMEALFDRAARLSRVEFVAPPTVIGRNTVHALQSGVVYGFAGPGGRHRAAHERRSSAASRACWRPVDSPG